MIGTSDWWLVPAGRLDVQSWSFGTIKQLSDFYEPKIFGPKEDLRCECGKFAGEASDDRTCDVCGVHVYANSRFARRQRIGKIDLAYPCGHPCDRSTLIEAFPVAPIEFRTKADGTANALGMKYEALLKVNVAAAASLPAKGTKEYYKAAFERDSAELVAALSLIVGRRADGNTPDEDSLLALAIDALARGKPSASTLIRCCGYAVEVATRI
jgi:hypothetical protein